MPPVPAMRSLDFMDSCRHHLDFMDLCGHQTTWSTSELCLRVRCLSFWSRNWMLWINNHRHLIDWDNQALQMPRKLCHTWEYPLTVLYWSSIGKLIHLTRGDVFWTCYHPQIVMSIQPLHLSMSQLSSLFLPWKVCHSNQGDIDLILHISTNGTWEGNEGSKK